MNEIDTYILQFPESTQQLLKQLRGLVLKAAPASEEVISYQMPAYKYYGMLVYFAGYKNHIGFYPGASGIAAFKQQLSIYKGAKGSVQFPLNKPLPSALIKDIVFFKVKENEMKRQRQNSNKVKK